MSEALHSGSKSTPISESFFSAELFEQLKAQLYPSLFAAVSVKFNSYEYELQHAQLMVQVLEERLRQQRIAKYGPDSEKLSDLQLELLKFEPGVGNAEVTAESEREPLPSTSDKKKRRKHPGRQTLPDDLPRAEKIIVCTPEQCKCGNCGADTKTIGYEISEVLEVKPAEYFVEVTKREKRASTPASKDRLPGTPACKKCEAQGVFTAPTPIRIIEKSLVSDAIIVDTIVTKYANHNPLYRQSVILLRDAGIDISRATMCGWVMTVGEMLMPAVGAMRRELLAGNYIQADETPVDVQMHDRRGKNHQSYLWQYGTPGGETAFDFRMGRDCEGPKKWLVNFDGILQTDGYAAYDRDIGGSKMVHAACWAHAQRYLIDAIKLNKQDASSVHIVASMDELFAIDARARNENMDDATRHALRLQEAPRLLEKIHEQILAMSKTVLPNSAVGKACSYTLRLWKRLTIFLEHPELELSNNIAENSMRGVALGRRNWIHIGSKEAGAKVAAILSVVESCRRLKIPVREYLADILPGLANRSIKSLEQLTPDGYVANKLK